MVGKLTGKIQEMSVWINLKMENQKNILDYKILYPFPKSYMDHGVKTIGYEMRLYFP